MSFLFDALERRYWHVRALISEACDHHDRPDHPFLLAVSKGQNAEHIRCLYRLGQRAFAESYIQEAMKKQNALADLDIEWYFIGRIQSNKTKFIAGHFSWCLSLDRWSVAKRLDEQRPEHLPALNVCLQVNMGQNPNRGGLFYQDVFPLVEKIHTSCHRLHFRGLMGIPEPSQDTNVQRHQYAKLRYCFEALKHSGYAIDTLSMGMSDDLSSAIAESSTMLRIGTALFGTRRPA